MELFEIDESGRVRDYQGTRLSRWQVSGRDFARELAWVVGAEAAARIAAFRARGLDLDRFATRVATRSGARALELTVRRTAGGATAVFVQDAIVPRDGQGGVPRPGGRDHRARPALLRRGGADDQ